MPTPDTLTVIRELAAEQFGGDAATLDVDAPVDKLGIDSLGMLEFLFDLEDKLGIPIPQDSVVGIKTLRELSNVIEGLKSGDTAAS